MNYPTGPGRPTPSFRLISLLSLWILSLSLCRAAPRAHFIEQLSQGKPQTIVTYGTSLTAGGAWVKQLDSALATAFPGQATLINSGAGGQWSTWGIKHLDARVIAKKPDAVIIEFSINDAFLKYKTPVAKARENLEQMIQRILAANAETEIILMCMNPPIGVHLERRPNIVAYYDMYRAVAKAKQLRLIDHYPNWDNILHADPDQFDAYVPDGIHPNALGCEKVITPEILRAIGLSTETKLPEGGTPLVAAANLAPGKLRVRLGGGSNGSKQIIKTTHPKFSEAISIHLEKRPLNTWDAGVAAATTAAIKKGDHLLISFWARGKSADGNGGGVAEFVFERNGAPYTKSVQYLIETPTNGEWDHFWIRLTSLEDYAPGQAILNYQLGYQAEQIDFGGIEAWNFGSEVSLESLPHTALTYVGRALDAPWRTEAQKRIEKYRRGDITVQVVDAAGKPKPGVPVHLHLDRLAFDIGTAAKASTIVGEGPDNEKYRKILKSTFNTATIENGLKWQQWEKFPKNQPRTLEALTWLNEVGLDVRGHVMVWPGPRYLPKNVTAQFDQPDKLRAAIDARIQYIGEAAGDNVRDWDVLNEVYDNRELTTILGDEEMVHWFREAKKVAPHAKLYYNDYAALVRGGFNTTHKDHFEQTLRYLVDNGAPIDGVGIQGHFGSLLTPPHRLMSELDRWAAFDRTILITEFDVTVPDEKLRADFTRDFLITCFSHPKVDGIIAWGFWKGAQWRPEASFYEKDWTLTPMGREWVRLTTKTWITDETHISNEKGQVTLRGYTGKYTATAAETALTFTLTPEGTRLTLTAKK